MSTLTEVGGGAGSGEDEGGAVEPRLARPGRFLRPAALLALLVGVWLLVGRAPAPPPLFEDDVELATALGEARADGGLVFAVATADWCAPCRRYRRGALADPRVAAWVRAHAVPVHVDVDEHPEAASALGVSVIPCTFLLREGRVLARAEGVMESDALLRWLEDAPS